MDQGGDAMRTVVRTHLATITSRAAALFIVGILAQGCIVIRSTEQRVWFKKDGTGEGILRLIDVRSDETTPEGVKADFESMMNLYLQTGLEDFENSGRKVTGKNLYLSGDTLIAEIRYAFTAVSALDEMRFNNEETFVVVPAGKIIVRHNGSVESYFGDSRRIVWDRDTPRVMYQIAEQRLPPSTSLAPLYASSMGK
jgi:hypothetical protein